MKVCGMAFSNRMEPIVIQIFRGNQKKWIRSLLLANSICKNNLLRLKRIVKVFGVKNWLKWANRFRMEYRSRFQKLLSILTDLKFYKCHSQLWLKRKPNLILKQKFRKIKIQTKLESKISLIKKWKKSKIL